jgi:hypothetical protein
LITTTFYKGQGLGNQLWSWAVLTSVALNNGYEWGVQAPWRFKGKSFMNLDMGKRVIGIASRTPSHSKIYGVKNYYHEKRFVHTYDRYDVSGFDSDLANVQDDVKIDGNFQSETYILGHEERITRAFQVQSLDIDLRNICVIHFRGGDYSPHDSLLLPPRYYRNSMSILKRQFPKIEFLIITNDTKLARSYFPNERIISNYQENEVYSGSDSKVDFRVSLDLSLLQNAPFLILSNSSFSWWGAWTNTRAVSVIAPKYWARHNANNGYWSTGGIITKKWRYVDSLGHESSFEECMKELNRFKESDHYFATRVI